MFQWRQAVVGGLEPGPPHVRARDILIRRLLGAELLHEGRGSRPVIMILEPIDLLGARRTLVLFQGRMGAKPDRGVGC